jgi:hypothetical protein
MTTTIATILSAITIAARMDKAGANLWVTLCNALKGASYDQAVALVESGEADWKAANPKATAMPSAWRSNKSVAMAALKNAVALFDDADKCKGKSAVEAELKELKGDKPVLDKVRSTLDTLTKLYAQCDATERAEARALIASLSIRLYEEAKAQGEVA